MENLTPSGKEFGILLELFMINDPWPLSRDDYIILENFLDKVSVLYGYTSWLDAYHKLTN
jgi:hypothetical protein